MRRCLVILDLDETLVHVPDHPLQRRADFHVMGRPGYRRPHLAAFLEALHDLYDVAVWTSAERPYAEAVLTEILPRREALAFVWTSAECAPHQGRETSATARIKRLADVASLGFDLRRTVMVDDAPEKHLRRRPTTGALAPGATDELESAAVALLVIPPFLGDPDDIELPRMLALIHQHLGSFA